MITATCNHCHKTFTHYPSQKNRLYCSSKCWREHTASLVETTCPQCGKAFQYNTSWPRVYCSKNCSAQANADKQKVFVACDYCGKEFSRNPFELNKTVHHFCSRQCFSAHQSKTMKGQKPVFAGMKHPKRTAQGTVNKQCEVCGKTFKVKRSRNDTRNPRFCSRQCEAEWQSERWSGENNPAWRGGEALEYRGPNWRQQRRNARRRDGYICQRCGITEAELGQQLDVHHIKPFRAFGVEQYQEANKLDNLISYCGSCHLVIEHAQHTRPNP